MVGSTAFDAIFFSLLSASIAFALALSLSPSLVVPQVWDHFANEWGSPSRAVWCGIHYRGQYDRLVGGSRLIHSRL